MNALHTSLSVLGGKLDPKITKCLRKSLGSIDDLQLTKKDDRVAWQIDIPNPLLGNDYKPFFFDRGNEFGGGHRYHEALCHASKSGVERFALLTTSTARYANRTAKTSFETLLCPATLPLIAFVDALRAVNQPYLDSLEDRLSKLPGIDQFALADFVSGMFRNVAIQIHYGGASEPKEQTMHLDHLHSALHMALTLNGTRDILFTRGDHMLSHTLALDDCYVTSPTRVLHGIGVPTCTKKEASISVQLRTLMSRDTANSIYPFSDQVCDTVLDLLRVYDELFSLPSYEDFQKHLQLVEAEADAARGKNVPDTITFSNPALV